MEKNSRLNDIGAERSLIGTVFNHGKDVMIDVQGVVDTTDFFLPWNKAIFTSLKSLAEDSNCEQFDTETVKLKMNAMGFSDYTKDPKFLQYLELIQETSSEPENISFFAYSIKKYSVTRQLHKSYTDALKYIENVSDEETISDILNKAEGMVVDFVSGIDSQQDLHNLSEDIEKYIEQKLQEEIVDQIGIPTGFPQYDAAIGQGLRRGAISVIGARSKVGKSFVGMNMAINIAKIGVPVLYLDSELTEKYQRDRMICISSGCPIEDFETGKFKYSKDKVQAVMDSIQMIKGIPLHYKSINGMSHTEALAFARRWIVKHVGFNEKGEANDCVIVYDYLKLTSGDGLSSFMSEYLLLGLAITEMHNFAVKYSVPFLTFVQLNRDGIDNDHSGVVAGSDRILWLCSSLSFLKNKDQNDDGLGCGWDFGNKKIIIADTRYGSGMEKEGDYINIHASLRPNVSKQNASGHMREGLLYSEVVGGAGGQRE